VRAGRIDLTHATEPLSANACQALDGLFRSALAKLRRTSLAHNARQNLVRTPSFLLLVPDPSFLFQDDITEALLIALPHLKSGP